jgi:hypothetical protein
LLLCAIYLLLENNKLDFKSELTFSALPTLQGYLYTYMQIYINILLHNANIEIWNFLFAHKMHFHDREWERENVSNIHLSQNGPKNFDKFISILLFCVANLTTTQMDNTMRLCSHEIERERERAWIEIISSEHMFD